MEIFKKSFLELIGVFAFLAIIFLVLYYISDDDVDPRVVNASLAGQEIILEIADNTYLQNIGLSGREEMPMDYGMIFVYGDELENLTFWMKDTLMPLDMIFLNKELEVVHVIENVPVCEQEPCESYTFDGKAQFVIELNSGWVEEYGVEQGEVLKFKVPNLFDS